MKWYDKNHHKMLDLNTINGFVYIPAKEYILQNPHESDVADFERNGDRIELIIGGSIFVFRGETAKELYDLLMSEVKDTNKELLKG